MARLSVTTTDRTTLSRIADGTLSPLTGPMGRQDYDQVLAEGAIQRDGKRWAWTIPIVLPVDEHEARLCRQGSELALACGGEVFGQIRVDSCWRWQKSEFVRMVYGTDRTDHPGARLWLEDPREWLVGGEILIAPPRDERTFASFVLSPRQTRKLIEEREWEQAIAFQTRNPLHRAHEYALIYGAEQIIKNGKRTGVVLNPLVGELKSDDVPAETRMRTYRILVEEKLLGQGDMDLALWKQMGQDLHKNLVLVGLDMRMFYGGPREAVMHAIYRQNLGFTHFIIGRKHADAPFDDGKPIWGDFDAQQIFHKLGGELSIKTVNVGFAAFFQEIDRVGLVEENQGRTQVTISGTKMRELLGRGELPDARVMRPATAKILADYYQSKQPKP
jgi:sulfate adenylyltransferase